jgi:hypothetical protein
MTFLSYHAFTGLLFLHHYVKGSQLKFVSVLPAAAAPPQVLKLSAAATPAVHHLSAANRGGTSSSSLSIVNRKHQQPSW